MGKAQKPRAGHKKRKALKRRRPGGPRGVASLNGNAEALLSELDALRATVSSTDTPTQPPLIPLSAEEFDEAARNLAKLEGDFEEMEKEHAKGRKSMRTEREQARKKISAVASTLRNRGR